MEYRKPACNISNHNPFYKAYHIKQSEYTSTGNNEVVERNLAVFHGNIDGKKQQAPGIGCNENGKYVLAHFVLGL